MPVDLSIVESTTELGQTVVEVVLDSSSAPGVAGPGVPTGGTNNQVLTKQSATDFDTDWEDAQGAGGGAPDDATYLVTTAHGDLSAEVVVGATPGGELGGTWAVPTVDATHSGSSHASTQAAAEATAAAALSSHEGDTTSVHGLADTSVLATDSEVATAVSDHSADTTSVHGIADTSALALTANHPSNATFNDHSARHENGGADEISLAGLDGTSVELAAHLADAADAHDASASSVADAGDYFAGAEVEAVTQDLGLTRKDGWVPSGETWTYASADDPTFTFTVAGVDLTGKYSAGMRIKLTQTTAKYFIITKVAFSTDTTITIYGGSDYDLANAAISSPFYSLDKTPQGFPLSPAKWTQTTTYTSTTSQATPTATTWYNVGTITLVVPIGVWEVSYVGTVGCDKAGAGTIADVYATLSTANNTEASKDWTFLLQTSDASAAGKAIVSAVHRQGLLDLSAKATYYLNLMTDIASMSNVTVYGASSSMIVRAVCAYL